MDDPSLMGGSHDNRSEDLVTIRRRLSSRSATNTLLAAICALLVLQLVASRTELFLPRRLLAEDSAARQGDQPQPVYLVAGPSGGRLEMLPVGLVYLDQKGSLGDVVSPDGSVRVRVTPSGADH